MFGPVKCLRRSFGRRTLALFAVFSILAMSTAQAAHSHRIDAAHPFQTHVECLLCMHTDRMAAAPDLPKPPAIFIACSIVIAFLSTAFVLDTPSNPYRARGPPRS
jgi:hypothetical protein